MKKQKNVNLNKRMHVFAVAMSSHNRLATFLQQTEPNIEKGRFWLLLFPIRNAAYEKANYEHRAVVIYTTINSMAHLPKKKKMTYFGLLKRIFGS